MEMFNKFKNASFFNNMFLKIKKTEEVIKEKENKSETISSYIVKTTTVGIFSIFCLMFSMDPRPISNGFFYIPLSIMGLLLSVMVSFLITIPISAYISNKLTKQNKITLESIKREFISDVKSDKKFMQDISSLVVDEKTEDLYLELVKTIIEEKKGKYSYHENFYKKLLELLEANKEVTGLKDFLETEEIVVKSYKEKSVFKKEEYKLKAEKLKELYKI